VVGAVVLKQFSLQRERKCGLIYWILTDPKARGFGVGQCLVEAGIELLEKNGCHEIFGCVEGNNTSSSKLFLTRGFGVLSPGAQIRRFGWQTLALWLKTFHYIDIGHFLFVRPAPQKRDRPAIQWWGTFALNALLVFLAHWRLVGFGSIRMDMFIALSLALILLLVLRHGSMKLAARRQGLAVRFRAWESGFPLSAAIALACGFFYPVPGNLYPKSDQWRYRDEVPRLGRVALAGTSTILLAGWGIYASLRFGIAPTHWNPWLKEALVICRSLALFDIVLAFFPFVSYNGRRLWDWNKALWAASAVAAIALLFV